MFLKQFKVLVTLVCILLCAALFGLKIYVTIPFSTRSCCPDHLNITRNNLPHQIYVSREAVEQASRVPHECQACHSKEESNTLLLVLSRPNSTLHRARLRYSVGGSKHRLVFALSMNQKGNDEHALRNESEQYKDIVPGNFSLEQDTTLGVFFAFSLVIRYFTHSKYVMVVEDDIVLNMQPLDEVFKYVEKFDDGNTIFGYIVNELDYTALSDPENRFGFMNYFVPGAVIYPTKLVYKLFSGGMIFSGCRATKDSFFSGLVAANIGINLNHIDSFDAFCNLPTVCKSAPVLMNCFDLNGQCAKDEIY